MNIQSLKLYNTTIGKIQNNCKNNLNFTSLSCDTFSKTKPEIKTVVIEDAQYLMAFEAMDRANEKGYDKFTQIATNFYSVLKKVINMRDDLKVFVLTHAENVGDSLSPSWKIKTIGKVLPV